MAAANRTVLCQVKGRTSKHETRKSETGSGAKEEAAAAVAAENKTGLQRVSPVVVEPEVSLLPSARLRSLPRDIGRAPRSESQRGCST